MWHPSRLVALSLALLLSILSKSWSFSSTTSHKTSIPTRDLTIYKLRPSSLYSQSESNGFSKGIKSRSFVDDVSEISIYLASCVIFAITLTVYEGYDCSFLKPLPATIRNFPQLDSAGAPLVYLKENDQDLNILNLMMSSTRGMGRGKIDRAEEWYIDTYLTSRDALRLEVQVGKNIPSYNEIMLQHRTSRVPTWKQEIIAEKDIFAAVESIIHALETINRLKAHSSEYEWDQMLVILREPALTTDLQDGCSILQRARDFLSTEVRQEIGFDWGSCAWRHCGAQADAQESLAELYNSIGMFEPFECLFTLDIVERSLRDIVTAIPKDYKPTAQVLTERIGDYIPYESVGVDEDGTDSIDIDYLDALADLKNSISFDGDE